MISRIDTLSYSGIRQIMLALTALSALSLSGCSVNMPSKIMAEPIQLVSENHSKRYAVSDLTAADYDQMAEHYSRYGASEAEVIVAYDPRSKKNTAMMASDQLHKISDELARRGVHDMKSSILAVENSGDHSEMVIGYNSVTAQAPDDCDLMPGYESGQAEADIESDYKLGCTMKTMVSRQIAHPQDLAGRASDTQGDGRRAGVVVETYRTGARNRGLSGSYSSTGN